MGISKATFASALTSLTVITTAPAGAYDFSKPLSCAVTVYGSGSAMWTWADVSNGTGNRVVKEAGPVMMNGLEVQNHTPAIWTWSDDTPNDWQINGPVPKGSLTLIPLDEPTTRIIALGAAKMTDDRDAVRAVFIRATGKLQASALAGVKSDSDAVKSFGRAKTGSIHAWFPQITSSASPPGRAR